MKVIYLSDNELKHYVEQRLHGRLNIVFPRNRDIATHFPCKDANRMKKNE